MKDGTLDQLAVELRFAWRQLVARPGTTAIALAVLALGIGSGTAVFSVVDGVVLSPLPYPQPERLLHVTLVDVEQRNELPVAPPAYLLWSADSRRTVEGVAALTSNGMDLVGAAEPEHVEAAAVGHRFFDVMGVRPAHGRGFLADEDRAGGAPVVVLSHALWSGRFGGEPSLAGRTVRLGGVAHAVVGVMPADFDFPAGSDVWVPLGPVIEGMEDVWGALFLDAVVRLRPGVAAEEARAELASVLAAVPDAARWEPVLTPLRERLVGDVRAPLLLLLGAVALVLVVACANVGGLLLARAAGRGRELSLRAALGAGRGRLAMGLLAESVLLAAAAGALGVGAAVLALDAVVTLAPGDLPRGAEIAVDARVLAFGLGATLLTGLVAGALPAVRVRPDVAGALREGEGQTAGRAAGRTRTLLVTGQVAVTVVLLAGAALLGRSFLRLMSQDVGFDARGVAAVELDLPGHAYPDDASLLRAYGELRDAAARIPGVEEAALTRNLPLAGRRLGAPVRREDVDASAGATHVSATPGYLELMRTTVVRGRSFTEADVAEGRPVAVLSESLARSLFGPVDPVGRSVTTMFGNESMEVVGVVRDVRHASPGTEPGPVLYRPLSHWTSRGVHVVVRSSLPPGMLLPALRQAVRSVDPQQAIVEVVTLDTLLSRTVARPRFYAALLASFAGVALLLSMLGFHALLASFVHQRQREIGIRMALGASAGRVRRMVVGRGLALTAAGLVAGMAGVLALHRVVEGLLFGVGSTDVPTLAAVVVLTLATGAAAAYPVARRATRTDPAEVMRG